MNKSELGVMIDAAAGLHMIWQREQSEQNASIVQVAIRLIALGAGLPQEEVRRRITERALELQRRADIIWQRIEAERNHRNGHGTFRVVEGGAP